MFIAARISHLFVRSFFVFCFITFSLTTAFGAGEVDPTFNASIRMEGGAGYVTELQPDGKILVGGLFTTANEAARSGIARFNSDGTLDNSFDVVEISGLSGQGGKVYAIELQPDGKIIVGGEFKFVNGVLRWSVARLNSDGSLDESFNAPLTPQFASTAGEVFDLKVRSYAVGRSK